MTLSIPVLVRPSLSQTSLVSLCIDSGRPAILLWMPSSGRSTVVDATWPIRQLVDTVPPIGYFVGVPFPKRIRSVTMPWYSVGGSIPTWPLGTRSCCVPTLWIPKGHSWWTLPLPTFHVRSPTVRVRVAASVPIGRSSRDVASDGTVIATPSHKRTTTFDVVEHPSVP